MNEFTRSVIDLRLPQIFTMEDVRIIISEDKQMLKQMKLAIQSGDIIKISRGVFTLKKELRLEPLIDTFLLSSKLSPLSYVSMESALCDAGWIPEAVRNETCVTQEKEKIIQTDFCNFYYYSVPQKDNTKGVQTIRTIDGSYKKAKPLKAIVDYVCARKKNWKGIQPLIESLRIEDEDLATLTKEDFIELQGNYPLFPNAELFLDGLRNDISL